MASTLKPLRYYDKKMKKITKAIKKNKETKQKKQNEAEKKGQTNKSQTLLSVCRYTAILSSGNQPLHYFYLNLLNELCITSN